MVDKSITRVILKKISKKFRELKIWDHMKTAISIPDNVYHAAEMVAKKLNISRSELYTKAIKDYVNKHEKSHITEALNSIYVEEDSSLDAAFLDSQNLSIGDESW